MACRLVAAASGVSSGTFAPVAGGRHSRSFKGNQDISRHLGRLDLHRPLNADMPLIRYRVVTGAASLLSRRLASAAHPATLDSVEGE